MAAVELRGEKERNRLLRRTDWRFLLPNPMPARSICFTQGYLARALAQVSELVLPCDRSASAACDLAVAVNPTRATLAAAAAALRPGGACYSEWYSPFVGGPQGIRQRLQAVGFEDVSLYWPWPWPSRAPSAFWLPIEARGALQYFLERRPKAASRAGRAEQTAVRALWQLSVARGLARPLCAIARKPTPGDRARQARELDWLDAVHCHWESWGLGPRPTHLTRLLLTGGLRSINKPVALVFAGQECRPRLAVKMTRVAEAAPGLAREAAVLQAIQAQRPDSMGGIPRVLFREAFGEMSIAGQTALDGQPLLTHLRPATYRQLALKATDWLARLAEGAGVQPRTAWWARIVEPVLENFQADFCSVVDAGQLEQTRRCLASLDNLPSVPEQRDFSPWNVLIDDKGELVVLDWESAEVEGLPVLDLIYFLTYLAFFHDGAMASGRWRESYRASLDPATLTGATRVECLTRYCQQTGLDLAALRPLQQLVWLLHAHSEYQRLVADAGVGKPSEAALRASLFVSLWQEEGRSHA